jgi:hypothetical protein
MKGAAELVLAAWRRDGRYHLGPSGTSQPCHTSLAAHLLCRLGYAQDERLEKTFQHLLETQYADGGWRCNKFFFGRGPETEFSNPGATLGAHASPVPARGRAGRRGEREPGARGPRVLQKGRAKREGDRTVSGDPSEPRAVNAYFSAMDSILMMPSSSLPLTSTSRLSGRLVL